MRKSTSDLVDNNQVGYAEQSSFMIKLAKKKVLILMTESDQSDVQRYFYDLIMNLPATDYLVEVVYLGASDLPPKISQSGITVHQIEKKEASIKTSWKESLYCYRSLSLIIKGLQPDILHLGNERLLLGSLVGRLCSVPRIIFTYHHEFLSSDSLTVSHYLNRFTTYLSTQLAHQIIYTSQSDFKNQHPPFSKHKSRLIYPGISSTPTLDRTEARLALVSETNIKVNASSAWLLSVGGLVQHKNHTVVIDAVAEYNTVHPDKICYIIIGTGESKNALSEQIDLRGMTDYIFIVEQDDDINRYLKAFDLFIITSKTEGLPYSLIDAGLNNLPVLVSPVGGLPEVIKDQYNGLFVDPDNHMSIVSALEQLITHPELRIKYSANLNQLVTESFRLESMIADTLKCYAGTSSSI